MPTYGEFGRDYRAVMKTIKPGSYEYVTIKHENLIYKVFQLSIWEDDVDGKLTGVVELSSRTFKNNTVFYLNTSRDLMLPLKIAAAGDVHYLIEPMPDAQKLVAARLGIGISEYGTVVLEGGLRDLFSRELFRTRVRYGLRLKKQQAKTSDAIARAETIRYDKALLEHDKSVRLGELGRMRDELHVSKNILAAKEAENKILREFIEKHGLTPPECRPRYPSA